MKTAVQIKAEYLGTLGGWTPTATDTINMDRAMAEAYARLLVLYGPSKSLTSMACNELWSLYAMSRLALLTDGQGSARAVRTAQDFEAFEKLTTTEKCADRYFSSGAAVYPPWMAGLQKSVGDIVVPTAMVDAQLTSTPPTVAWQASAIGSGLTGTTEPSWAAPYYQSAGTATFGQFVFGGYFGGSAMWVTVLAGTPWWLWYDGIGNRFVLSLIPGTLGAVYWTNAVAITGAYTPNGTALTLAIGAGGSTITDNGVTWTAITFP